MWLFVIVRLMTTNRVSEGVVQYACKHTLRKHVRPIAWHVDVSACNSDARKCTPDECTYI